MPSVSNRTSASHKLSPTAKIFGLSLLVLVLAIGSSVFISPSATASSQKTNLLRTAFAKLTSVFQNPQSEQEPNENIDQANAISIPSQITGSAKVGDAAVFEFQYNNGPKDKIEDFFTFSVPTNQTRQVDITLTFDNPAADLDLLLFKLENGAPSAKAVSNGATTTERITPILTLDQGTYLIGVSAFDDPGNTASANYTLNVVLSTQAPPPTISSITPQSVSAGNGPLSITVNGSNFIFGQSVVRLNGQNKTTTFITDKQLVAFLSAADTATPGTNFITVFNPPSLGGQSGALPFVVVPPNAPEPEVEPNETSQQATLLLAPGRRSGVVATGDPALTTIQLNNGLSDPVEDLFGVTLAQSSRLDLSLKASGQGVNLALYLMREIDSAGAFTVIGNSRFSGAIQRITTPAMLAPGRYLVGVSAVTGSAAYTIEASIPGNRLLQVNTSSAAPNSVVTVPVSFFSEGNENSFGFSLSFDTATLGSPQVSLGSDVAGATLNVNTSQVAQGRIGVQVTLPQGQRLTSGAREIARINFSIAPNLGSGSTAVEFTDDPVVRTLVDASGHALIGSYADGAVIVVPGFEADVSPRPQGSGDGAVTISDWTQVGRFTAGLDTPADGSEFQRADCAPKTTLGDGRLTIADWVLAGRYAAGLETAAAAGGPTAAVSSLMAAEKKLSRPIAHRLAEAEQLQTRAVSVIPAVFNRGLENVLSIELSSLGNENAVGFSLNFDTTQLNFARATLGADAAGAILNINPAQVALGRLGIGLALPSGQTFQTGVRQILTVTFIVPPTSSVNSTTVSFGDQPVLKEVVDANANLLPANFPPGVITLNPPIMGPPVLTSLNPDTVIVGGPSFTLTITGSNFVNGAVAQIDGVDRPTQFVSDTELRAAILAQDIVETGTVGVTVRNPDPNTGVSNALDLSVVNPVPALTSISPNSAATGSLAITLTLTGSNFVPGATVQWNGSNRITTVVDSTRLTAQILTSDLTTAGTATVGVVNPAPGGGTSNTLNFTISSPSPIPRVTTISPDSIQAGSAGFTLTVNGSGFANSSVVRINGNPLPTTFVSANQLTAQVSASDIANPGAASITVFNPPPGGGTSNAAILSVSVPPNPVPAITALDPSAVTAGGGAFTLTVTGSNFVQNSVVRFTGQDRQTNFISATELRASILASDILNGGSATVTVFNPTPAGGVSNALTLTINFAPPAITALSPVSAVAGGPAFQLTVIGTNFAPGSVVRWNGQDRVTQFISVTELVIQVPASDIANVGSATISVFSPPPGGGLSNEVTFNITEASRPLPRITTISPNNAAAGGADFTLTVNGQNFVSDSVVRWNGSPRPTMFVNSTALTAQISAADIAAAGTASVTVFTPPAGGGESNAAVFTINAPPNPVPVITSLSPASVGAGGPAFTLTVNGTGFVVGSVAQVNGANRQTTVVSATQLTVQITAEEIAVSGSVAIRVFNPEPGGGISNQVELTVANPVPTITSLNPNVVAEGSGTFVLAVNGTNFIFGAQILINNVPRITNFSPTQLTTTIQASEVVTPTTLNVQVVNPAPGGGTSNTVALEVRRRNPIPRINSISPETVSAGGPGFVLIVNGTGFAQGSVARVNGQDRQTDFVSETSLAVQIPASDIATGGTLAITVFNPSPGGGTSNPATLMINNPAPRITSISPDAAAAGSSAFTLIVNGSGFVTNSVVRFAGNDLQTSFVTSSQLSAVVPASSLGGAATVPVTVFNPAPGGGTSNSANFSITNPTPVIANIAPDQALAAGPSFTLTVNGSGFVSGLVVRVNGQDRQTNFVNGTQLTATILASDIVAGGTLNITVASPAPGGATSNTVPLAVINPVPAISGLSPNAVVAGSAAFTLTVNGSGFVPGAVVNVNGSARATAFVNSGQLTAQVNAADIASIGTASVTVVNPAPGGGVSNAATLTISTQPNPTPAISTLTPNSIAAGSAAFTLTVNGTGFVPGAVVNWNGSPRTTAFGSDTQLTAQITAEDVAAQGAASVTVVNPAPGGGASNAVTFTVTPPNPVPTLTSLTPNTAAVGSPAFTLTVNGANFVPGAVVNWNGSPRQTTFFSASQLFAQISSDDVANIGTASVTVVNPAPGGGASNALTFTVSAQPNPAPAITALNPDNAIAGDDPFTLVVTGTNFVAGSVVQWNGGVRPTTVVSGTELRAQISADDVAAAGAATITVFNPAPGGGMSNALTFAITALQCQTICLQSSQYYLGNVGSLPSGQVLIGGVNFNTPISVQDNVQEVLRALEGGATPLQLLNQQFVAMQLNAIPNASFGGTLPPAVLASTLRCYRVNFTPAQLSNGFMLSRDMTFGQLLAQSQSAILENRTDDMSKLAAVLALLNGNDPNNRCQ
jgi:hypothetical protein